MEPILTIPSTADASSAPLTKTERFRRAISGRRGDRPPVWLMRQAGRYMPQYHTVRNRFDFMALCRTPEAAAEVSLQPLDEFDMDAVIVFNDIVTPMEAMGTPVIFGDAGPTLENPIRTEADLARFAAAEFDNNEPVAQTLRLLRDRIGPDTALLGFAGCPFTLACYAVEGKLTRHLTIIKEMKNRAPKLLHEILDRLTTTVIAYLKIQIAAGADLVQIFDTWAADLARADYEEFAHAYQARVIDGVRGLGVPVTLYLNNCAPVLDLMARSGADVLSVDWRLPLSEVRRRVGPHLTLQGNLDPLALYDSPEGVVRATRAMLDDLGDDPMFIANLGHGILPQTPMESVRAFVNTVKERGQ